MAVRVHPSGPDTVTAISPEGSFTHSAATAEGSFHVAQQPPARAATQPGSMSKGSSFNKTLKRVKSFRTTTRMDQLIQSRAQQTMTKLQEEAPKGTESLDFDLHEKEQLRATAELPGPVRTALLRRKAALSSCFTLVLGLCVGLVAFCLSKATEELSQAKWEWVRGAVHRGDFVLGWVRLVIASAGFAAVASLLTYWAPVAAGSGIPHVKSYLNGNKLPGVLLPRTLVAKICGITCCVAAGIPVGREGPMVHAGAIIAANLATIWAKLVTLRLPAVSVSIHGGSGVPSSALAAGRRLSQEGSSSAAAPAAAATAAAAAAAKATQKKLEREAGGFDNDRDRRNLVSMGAAAGVAAAFGAPIGGILFSLEEVSSFWDPQLTWTTFIAAAVAAFTVDALKAATDGDGAIGGGTYGLVLAVSTGEGSAACKQSSDYEIWEVLPFLLIGLGCGLLGAGFNAANRRLTLARKAWHKRRHRGWAVLEAVASVALLTSLFFWLCFAGGCHAAPAELHDVPSVVYEPHHCDATVAPSEASDGGVRRRLYGGGEQVAYAEMNELATLLLQPQEEALLQLFSRSSPSYFGLPALFGFVAVYFLAAVYTYGLYFPSGLFVPCMLIGAGTGRLVGELVRATGWGFTEVVDPGLYALVGAAGMLGGVTRMTISLTVILLEVSSDINLLMPIMIAILAAKLVGDRFTTSLYDIHIRLGGSTILESAPQPESSAFLLPAKAIMSAQLRTVRESEELGVLRQLLDTTSHSGFPVVEGDSRTFSGIISRAKLEELVARHAADAAAASAAQCAPPPGASRRAENLCRVPGAQPHVGAPPPLQRRDSGERPPLIRRNSGGGGGERRPSIGGCAGERPPSNGGCGGDGKWSFTARGPPSRPKERAFEPGGGRSSPSGSRSTPEQPRRRPNDGRTSPPRARSPRLERRPSIGGFNDRRSSNGGFNGGSWVGAVPGFKSSKFAAPLANGGAARVGKKMIDLRPYCDPSPYTVHELLPLYRVVRLFTSMGLRHLCVLDSGSRVCGVITRKDFARAQRSGLQELSSYAHLVGGGVVQKRMLDASHQADRLKRRSAGSHEHHEGAPLKKTFSEPSLLPMAAARVAAEIEEQTSFRRRRSLSCAKNVQMATFLKMHARQHAAEGKAFHLGDGAATTCTQAAVAAVAAAAAAAAESAPSKSPAAERRTSPARYYAPGSDQSFSQRSEQSGISMPQQQAVSDSLLAPPGTIELSDA